MVVITDPLSPEFPLPESMLVNVQESLDLIIYLLENLTKICDRKRTGHCLDKAINMANGILKQNGGRIFVFLANNEEVGEEQGKEPDSNFNFLLPNSKCFK